MKTIGQMAAELLKEATEPVTPKGEDTESKIVNALNRNKRLARGGYDAKAVDRQKAKITGAMKPQMLAHYMLRGDKWAPGSANLGRPMSEAPEWARPKSSWGSWLKANKPEKPVTGARERAALARDKKAADDMAFLRYADRTFGGQGETTLTKKPVTGAR